MDPSEGRARPERGHGGVAGDVRPRLDRVRTQTGPQGTGVTAGAPTTRPGRSTEAQLRFPDPESPTSLAHRAKVDPVSDLAGAAPTRVVMTLPLNSRRPTTSLESAADWWVGRSFSLLPNPNQKLKTKGVEGKELRFPLYRKFAVQTTLIY